MSEFTVKWRTIDAPTGLEQVSQWIEVATHSRIAVELDDVPVMVFMWVRWFGSEYGATAMQVVPDADAAPLLDAFQAGEPMPAPPSTQLLTNVLRDIPFLSIVAESVRFLPRAIPMEGDLAFNRSMDSTLDMIGDVKPHPRGQPIGRDQLIFAARVYELAAVLGRAPTATLAARLGDSPRGASLSTGRAWVSQARAAGLISVEPRPGRRGLDSKPVNSHLVTIETLDSSGADSRPLSDSGVSVAKTLIEEVIKASDRTEKRTLDPEPRTRDGIR